MPSYKDGGRYLSYLCSEPITVTFDKIDEIEADNKYQNEAKTNGAEVKEVTKWKKLLSLIENETN